MRVVFVLLTGFFALLSLLCLVRVATVVPDQAAIVRWLAAGFGSAFIAVFWDVVRRRYAERGTLEADPLLAGLGVAGVLVLVVVMLVFRATA